MPTLLKDLRIEEVSSVDRGAGEGVKIMMMKRQFSDDDRKRLAASGAALPDGSFPIENKSDLENAVHAFGRASDKAKAKSHIISRARALGCTDSLPEDWNVSKGDPEMTEEEKKAAEAKAKKDKEDAEKAEKSLKDELAIAKRELAILKMSQKHKDYMGACDMSDDEKDKFAAKSPSERDDHMEKNPIEKRMPEHITKALAQAEEDRKVLKALQEKDQIATFAKKATDLGLTEAQGEILRKARSGDDAAWGDLEKTIKGLTAARASSGLFTEIGKRGGAPGDGTAKGDLLAKAEEVKKALVATGKRCSDAQAFTKVYTDPANAALKKAYDQEEARAAAQRAA